MEIDSPNEPFRVILGDVRDKLYNTRECTCQLLSNGIFDIPEGVTKFAIDRITKNTTIYDFVKLRWMNGQHLRALPVDKLTKKLGEHWKNAGILSKSEGPFVNEVVELLKDGIDLVSDSDQALANLFSSPEGKDVLNDNLSEVVEALLSAYDNGELQNALENCSSGWKNWVKTFGKALIQLWGR